MRNNSIFENTMADMSYKDIEELIKKEAIVLFPIAVIEEHGPHLPLGTDTYLTYSMLRYVQEELNNMNVSSVIAPPFYWGINQATGGFAGSFTVKVETMKALLKDTIECLEKWGFKKVFLLNMHGDALHSKTIIEVAREIYESLADIDVYDIVPDFVKAIYGLSGKEPYLLYQKDENENVENHDDKEHKERIYLDVHAGGVETSLMLLEYENLVDEKQAKKLTSSKTTFEGLRQWQQGGDKAKEITPLGYLGDPSNINNEEAKIFMKYVSEITAKLIKNVI